MLSERCLDALEVPRAEHDGRQRLDGRRDVIHVTTAVPDHQDDPHPVEHIRNGSVD
jgi:hypothetical protein